MLRFWFRPRDINFFDVACSAGAIALVNDGHGLLAIPLGVACGLVSYHFERRISA